MAQHAKHVIKLTKKCIQYLISKPKTGMVAAVYHAKVFNLSFFA